MHGTDEQSNAKMDRVVRLFAAIAGQQECAIDLVHHTRKLLAGSSADLDSDDMRGASAIRDAVRTIRVLNQMPASEARTYAITDDNRKDYFRVDRVKANNARKSDVVWRKFVEVMLPNGTLDQDGDSVGVVTEWKCPGRGEQTEAMTEAKERARIVFLTILMRLSREGRKVNNKGHKYHAPTVFATEPEAMEAGLGKAQLENAMRELFKEKRIRLEEDPHENTSWLTT
jgi:RecA-family ATPase